jgi:hypothetical protein
LSNLQQYAKATVLWNGAILSEEASVSIKRASNAQVVKTVAKGFAGMSQGAAMVNISISNAVPSSGFEMDPGDLIMNNLIGQLTVILGDYSLSLTANGFITDDNFSHAVDTASKLDFEFVTGPAKWEKLS